MKILRTAKIFLERMWIERPLQMSGCTAAMFTALAVFPTPSAPTLHSLIVTLIGLFFSIATAFVFSASIRPALDGAFSFPALARISAIEKWLRAHGQDIFFFLVIFGLLFAYCGDCFGQVRIPGSDESAKLKAAGTLLMLMDTALFVWLARIFAGLCVLSAGWLIKEQKFGPAVVCVLGALVIGTSPMWVQNIFEIGGGGGVFK